MAYSFLPITGLQEVFINRWEPKEFVLQLKCNKFLIKYFTVKNIFIYSCAAIPLLLLLDLVMEWLSFKLHNFLKSKQINKSCFLDVIVMKSLPISTNIYETYLLPVSLNSGLRDEKIWNKNPGALYLNCFC